MTGIFTFALISVTLRRLSTQKHSKFINFNTDDCNLFDFMQILKLSSQSSHLFFDTDISQEIPCTRIGTIDHSINLARCQFEIHWLCLNMIENRFENKLCFDFKMRARFFWCRNPWVLEMYFMTIRVKFPSVWILFKYVRIFAMHSNEQRAREF